MIWTGGTDLLFDKDKSFVGGMQVQMFMWAKTFKSNGWDVTAITKKRCNHRKTINGINYYYYPSFSGLGPLISIFFTIIALINIQPSLILVNGATRDLYLVVLFSRLVGSKVVEVFASDSDLEPGNELIKRKLDRFFYRNGLRKTENFVVQNSRQEKFLTNNYKKENYIIVPSFWVNESPKIFLKMEKKIILWVANFRTLKRPEWFFELARLNPNEKFVMIGYPIDKSLFDKCRDFALTIPNIELIPGLGFNDTCKLFEIAHLFICTSEIEGFPNTFLQAWMNGCPVLSSFDPSNVIKSNALGLYCTTIEEFNTGIILFKDPDIYNVTSKNCVTYFDDNHNGETYYFKLKEHFKLK